MSKIKDYYQLTKPGIIRGNAITFLAGFFLASNGKVDLSLLAVALLGLSLIIASACVLNNYIDQDIDKLMTRTKKRALAAGSISGKSVLVFGSTLFTAGCLVLGLLINTYTLYVAAVGFFIYIAAYSYFKRQSHIGTVVGSLAGATPPVAGYVSVTNGFNLTALMLFLLLVFWQMPHFYSIAIYRLKEYKAAKIPVLPIAKGIRTTKLSILFHIALFFVACYFLYIFAHLSYIYLITVITLVLGWFMLGLRGLNTKSNKSWSREMFYYSLFVITMISLIISLNSVLA